MNVGIGNITLGATRLRNTVADEEEREKKKENRESNLRELSSPDSDDELE